jgi:hypothetical protein
MLPQGTGTLRFATIAESGIRSPAPIGEIVAGDSTNDVLYKGGGLREAQWLQRQVVELNDLVLSLGFSF